MSDLTKHIFRPLVILVRHASTGILIACLFMVDPAVPADVSDVRDDLASVVSSQFPGSKVVRVGDIDKEECGSVVGNPGFVEADFNGDGFKDFAALLMGDTKKVVEWQGKTLKLIEVKLVAFLKNDKGKFQPFLLERMDEYYPLALRIELEAPGEIVEFCRVQSPDLLS